MQIVYDLDALDAAMAEFPPRGPLGRGGGLSAASGARRPFPRGRGEVGDVDALRDHTGEVVIGGVMEHIEQAGVHSGDSARAIPPQTLDAETVRTIEADTHWPTRSTCEVCSTFSTP